MIRKANSKDIKIVHSLLLDEVSNGKVLKRSISELKRVINNFFVYEENRKIVGCCSLEIYSQKIAEIRSLVVALGYRNKGIGSVLIQRCLNMAKRKGIYQVLSITDKCNLFKRFGFRTEVNEKRPMFLRLNSDS